jgi:hypothetical protein
VILSLLTHLGPAKAQSEVDLALVLAVDISNSMDPEEQELQRKGFVEAFRSPLVHDAIGSGMLGRIAVVYLEWAGPTIQYVTVPWTEIGGPEDALSFADRLAQAPIRRGPRTSISGAIDASMKLLSESNAEAVRRVIDISGMASTIWADLSPRHEKKHWPKASSSTAFPCCSIVQQTPGTQSLSE